MSSGHAVETRTRGLAWRFAPFIALVVFGAGLLGLLPSAHAQDGTSAAEAVPVSTAGFFSGTVGPSASEWFHLYYGGNSQQQTIVLSYEPPDSSRLDMFLFTGTLSDLRQEGGASTRASLNNGSTSTLTQVFSDPSPRDLYIKVENDHPDRTVTFSGQVTPTSTLATPSTVTPTPTGTVTGTPTPGPQALTAANALTVSTSGPLVGTVGPLQPVWFRFWYGNPGANAYVTVNYAPSADNADLNIYTGDPSSLTEQSGSPSRSGNVLERSINLSSAQFVYFTVVNNNATPAIAYSATVQPFFAPPTTPTATATATPQATSVPTTTPQPAPPIAHDSRYFPQTGYRIDNDVIYQYFSARGALDTFGYPVSRTFTLLGCTVQMFQREVAQVCPGRGIALLNLLDPDIFPYTHVNGSTFPAPDPTLKNNTPSPSDPNYGAEIIQFVRANAPDIWQGQTVDFGQTFFSFVTPQVANTSDPNLLALMDLEIWGAPISQPMRDPSNSDFIYQRFQRGIMHRIVSQGTTRGILLADYLKAIIRNNGLPADLGAQAQGSKYFSQYCPGAAGWICRPADLPGTDFTFAFENG